MRKPTLADLCRDAPLPVLEAFMRRLLSVRPTRGARQAYETASRVRRARRTLPA